MIARANLSKSMSFYLQFETVVVNSPLLSFEYVCILLTPVMTCYLEKSKAPIALFVLF